MRHENLVALKKWLRALNQEPMSIREAINELSMHIAIRGSNIRPNCRDSTIDGKSDKVAGAQIIQKQELVISEQQMDFESSVFKA
nr:hypothetical protein [Pyxidicoccus parkwaysis]